MIWNCVFHNALFSWETRDSLEKNVQEHNYRTNKKKEEICYRLTRGIKKNYNQA